jgi:hypothetical protein
MKINGKSSHDAFPESPMGDIPGENFTIVFNSLAGVYIHKIKKVYSLSDIEKITNFKIIKIN